MQALELTLAIALLCAGLLTNTAVLLYVILRSLRAFGIPGARRRVPHVQLAPAPR